MNELNNDLISRKALIEAVEDLYEYAELDEVLDVIKNAPTVTPTIQLKDITDEDVARFAMIWQRATSKGLILEPERPHGKWVEGLHSYFSTLDCSLCGYSKPASHYIFNYCPNCGADMRTEGEP